jgi:hypothetical protein
MMNIELLKTIAKKTFYEDFGEPGCLSYLT